MEKLTRFKNRVVNQANNFKNFVKRKFEEDPVATVTSIVSLIAAVASLNNTLVKRKNAKTWEREVARREKLFYPPN